MNIAFQWGSHRPILLDIPDPMTFDLFIHTLTTLPLYLERAPRYQYKWYCNFPTDLHVHVYVCCIVQNTCLCVREYGYAPPNFLHVRRLKLPPHSWYYTFHTMSRVFYLMCTLAISRNPQCEGMYGRALRQQALAAQFSFLLSQQWNRFSE